VNACSASHSRPTLPSGLVGQRVSWSHRVWVVCAGVVVSLAVMNVVVGSLLSYRIGYRNDPVFGDVLGSGVLVQGAEGYCITSINSLGMRGPELNRTQHGTRILFLGDSFTEAHQVFDWQTFVDLSEHLLAARGVNVECVNAGLAGESPARYIGLSAAYRRAIQPAYVVVQVSDNDFSPEVLRPGLGAGSWWLKAEGATWIPTRTPSGYTSGETLRKFARFVPLVVYLKNRWGALASSGDSSSPAIGSSPANAALIDWVAAQLARDYGPNVAVLWVPGISYTGGPNPPTPIETEVAHACQRQGIKFLDPRDEMLAQFRRTGQPLLGFANTEPGVGHLNAEGHQVVAEVLAEGLVAPLSRLTTARAVP